MKIVKLSYADITGGAARAAYRIHQALMRRGVSSEMWVVDAKSGDPTVHGPESELGTALAKARWSVGALSNRVTRTASTELHSAAIVPSRWAERVNSCDADVVHLHWVNREMMSISDIGRIRKPVVWTLHDMWAFCGAEHYTEEFRWRVGYCSKSRSEHESGLDLNRWTWKRKKTHWRAPIQIVTPSHWLAKCVQESSLMGDWPLAVIHNPIDNERWKPLAQSVARELLGLPIGVPLLLFGAMGGGREPRKGFDLLQVALRRLRDEHQIKELELVIFGEVAPERSAGLGFPVHYTGHVHDDLNLRALYSAADAFVLPSRQDNLPNVGLESLACSTPVVAFDTCGLSDIVKHKETGYLATAFDSEDLARGIEWIVTLGDAERDKLRRNSREHAVKSFDYRVIAMQYQALYRDVCRVL